MFPLSPRFLILRSPLSLPSRHPLFYVSRFIAFSFRIGFLWCLSVLDYGFGMFVFGIAFMAAVYRHSSRPASILAALSPSPKRHLRRRRLLLRRSPPSLSSRNLHLSLRLRPSIFGSHSSAFSALVSRVESRS